jgi:hypothetical protein
MYYGVMFFVSRFAKILWLCPPNAAVVLRLLILVEVSSVVLCWCSDCVFYWSVYMRWIVFLYSFCSCDLTLRGECGNGTNWCVELF